MEESCQGRGKGHSDTLSLSLPSLSDTEENDIGPEKQRCFLCFNIILVASGSKSGHSNRNQSENESFLRQLCHELKINCVQQVSVNSTKIIFCYKCQQLCLEFNKVFKFYELAQLRLHNIMEKISREFGENFEPEPGELMATASLRKVIIEKTKVQLSELKSPLVLIQRLTQDEISLWTSTSTSLMKTEAVYDHDHDPEFKIPNLELAGLDVVVKTEVDVDDVAFEVVHQNLEQVDLFEEGDVFKWEAKVKKEEISEEEKEDAASTSRSRPRIRKAKKKIARPPQAAEPNTFQITSGGKFKCCRCSNKSFRSKTGWQAHFESIHQKIRHKCSKCSTTFSAIGTLNLHLKTCDGRRRPPPRTYPKDSFIKLENGQVQCNLDLELGAERHIQCQKPYSNKTAWQVHYLNIHQKLRFICEKCGSSFTQETGMKKHRSKCEGRRRTPSPSELAEGRTFSRHGVIGVYTKYFRLTQAGKFACKFCKKEYTNQSGFYAHYRSVHRNVRWKCEKCLQTFTQNCTLTKHQTVCPGAPKVSKKVKEHFCKFCGKGFTNPEWKKEHEQRHEGVRFKCEKCEKSFAYKHCLGRHVCTKSGDLQIQTEGRVGANGFKCKYCDLLFPTYLKRRNHYTVQRLRKFSYRCQKCHFIVAYQCGVAPHRENCEGAELTRIEENAPKFFCEICNKEFTSLTGLKGHHEGIHQGMKFKCKLCGKQYANQNNVRRHMVDSCPKSGTKAPPKPRHKCPKCPRDFSSLQGMGFHYDSVHLKRRVKCDQCGALLCSKIYVSRHKRMGFCPASKSNTADVKDADTNKDSSSS